MKLFFSYFKGKLVSVVTFTVTVLIFVTVLSLYDLETEAVFYAAVISGAFLATVFFVSFAAFALRYQKRKCLLDELGCAVAELPEPNTAAEAQYIEAIELLRQLLDKTVSANKRDRDEMLDYFTTWVHQIKIPISVMRMDLNSQDTPENSELQGELFRIEQYVEMVLCYFRLGDGGRDLVVRETELDPVIRSNVRKYAPVFIRKHIRLVYEGTQQKAVTDGKWLDLIIGQLLSNAVKYTKSGAVTVTVGSDRSITVSDTGIGIAPDDLPRIFERGYTGHNGRKGERSTGVGLYLVKKAADRIGAKLSVTSEVGKGTAVTLTLPEEIDGE